MNRQTKAGWFHRATWLVLVGLGVTGGGVEPAGGAGGRSDGITLLSSEAAWTQVQQDVAARPEAIQLLAAEAGRWLTGDTINIVAGKKHTAPSGNPHDYLSLSPYWWPNPARPDGLPWVSRDGEVNPQFYEYDNAKLESLCHAVPRLILYSRTADSGPHARRAGVLLRAWFLDEATRMNPHLRNAQFIPGVADGRGYGIIDTTSLIFLLDAVTHLPFNEDWTPEHLAGLKAWVSHYLDWLRTSEFGKREESERNNHGTWFDAQVVSYAAFCGRPELVREQIEKRTKQRIATQIEPDGAQPHELRRTLALTYCTYNLLAFACTARVARECGVDLWDWRSPNGRSLRSALHWMLPYYGGERPWTHQQIKPFDPTSAALVLTVARADSGNAIPAGLETGIEKYPWQRVFFSKAGLSARSAPGEAAKEPSPAGK